MIMIHTFKKKNVFVALILTTDGTQDANSGVSCQSCEHFNTSHVVLRGAKM